MFGRTGDDWTADIYFTHPQSAELIVSFLIKALFWSASSAQDNNATLCTGCNHWISV